MAPARPRKARGCRRGPPSGSAAAGTRAAGRGIARSPAVHAQPGAVLRAAPGDRRGDVLIRTCLRAWPGTVGTVDRARPGLRRPSARARASCQSPPRTSPASRRHSARPPAPRAAAARPRPGASPAAAASTSSPGPEPTSRGRTSRRIPVYSTNKIPHSTSRSSAACGQGDQPGAGSQVTTARSAPEAHQKPPTIAAVPSSRASSPSPCPPLFQIILLGVLRGENCQIRPGHMRCPHSPLARLPSGASLTPPAPAR
jgi:hypothetical protein